jgi:hypothetical protein
MRAKQGCLGLECGGAFAPPLLFFCFGFALVLVWSAAVLCSAAFVFSVSVQLVATA